MVDKNLYGCAYEYGTEEIQGHLLSILKMFHDDCVANSITYSLNSGSCLGAVRHNGFIPWDDDADVMLTRDNLDRYLTIAEKSSKYDLTRHLWIYRIKDKNDNLATIDLFAVDNVPDNKILRSFKVTLIKVLQGMMKKETNYKKFSFFYRICLIATRLMGALFSDETKYQLYEKVSRIGNNSKTKCVGIYNNLFKSLGRLYDCDLMEEVMLHDFEDTRLYITKEYDKYLKSVYGDYMKPPSIEQRKSGTFDIYCNDKHTVVSDSKHI